MMRLTRLPLIRQLSPYGGVSRSHPLFTLESSRVRRLLTRPGFMRLSVRVIIILVSGGLAIWGLAAYNDKYRSYLYAPAVTGQVAGWLFLMSIALDIMLDFACMVASVNSFSGEVIARRWDLLRLTPYPAEDFVTVKHSAARLRVWRMTMIVTVLRLIVIVMVILNEVFNNMLYGYTLRLEQITAYLSIAPFGLAYLIEPLWRSRVMTLLGLTISIRLRNGLSLILSAIGGVLAFWIAQIAVIGGIFWLTVSGINRLGPLAFDSLPIEIILLMASFYIGGVFYLFYALVWRIFYRRLVRRIDRAEA